MTVSLAASVRHPKIYAYTLTEYVEAPWEGARTGRGLIKVGYTDRDVDIRIREGLGVRMPTETQYRLLYSEAAITAAGDAFKDHDVHQALVRAGVHRRAGEWFECSVDDVRAAISAIKTGSPPRSLRYRASFAMRPEQLQAVEQTDRKSVV